MATAAQIATFIEMVAPLAVEQAKKHGNKIFASVCVAQAAHETGYGTSKTMMKYNAPFGIKVGKAAYHFGTAWKGESYNAKTIEYYGANLPATQIKDNFRAYSSLSDAVEDYFDLLCVASRYKEALNAPDYKACIRAIAPSYATGEVKNHAYSNAIIKIIESYNLTKYDSDEPLTNPYTRTLDLMKMGSRGESVKWLQWTLKNNGYEVGAIDGIFGTKTESAVKAFQTDKFVDGIVGKDTLGKLTK